ncbi:D-isomer specific 2-hydroxyacid dehydrogenase [Camillea tinctor]|nr:D-isomer specific 2-hydroxyacid dehydrogenase [Camillea tinctor]
MATAPETNHSIVALESFFCPVPALSLPAPHTYTLQDHSRTYTAAEAASRIRDATIVINTIFPLTAELLSPEATPRLRMISIVASGTDCVDLAACRARGIVVANSPHCNTGAVTEHAAALYFAVRRSVVRSHALTRRGEWTRTGSLVRSLDAPDGKPPRTCCDEVAGIVGYGGVGKRIEAMVRSLGMAKVLVAGRKGAATAPEGRVPFETVIRESTVIFVCLPRSPETLNLISDAEFEIMHPHAVLVNVSRGGIVDENALVAALRRRTITGAGTDVYLEEPAGPENSPLLAPDTADLNLVTTPHVAWCAEDTAANYRQTLKENITGWITTGEPKFRVV